MAEKRDVAGDPAIFQADEALRLAWDSCLDVLSESERERRHPRAIARSPQALFDALDGTEVCADGREWHIEVFSVLTDPTSTWVQLRVYGDSEHTLTLKLARTDDAAAATSILASWLIDPGDSSHVLNVG